MPLLLGGRFVAGQVQRIGDVVLHERPDEVIAGRFHHGGGHQRPFPAREAGVDQQPFWSARGLVVEETVNRADCFQSLRGCLPSGTDRETTLRQANTEGPGETAIPST